MHSERGCQVHLPGADREQDMSEEEPILNPTIWDIHATHPDLVTPLREKLAEVMDPEIGLECHPAGTGAQGEHRKWRS